MVLGRKLYAVDYEYMVRLFCAKKIKYLKVSLCSVIMREGGASISGWSSTHKISKEMVKGCIRNNIRTNYLLVLVRLPIKWLLQVWLSKIII